MNVGIGFLFLLRRRLIELALIMILVRATGKDSAVLIELTAVVIGLIAVVKL